MKLIIELLEEQKIRSKTLIPEAKSPVTKAHKDGLEAGYEMGLDYAIEVLKKVYDLEETPRAAK